MSGYHTISIPEPELDAAIAKCCEMHGDDYHPDDVRAAFIYWLEHTVQEMVNDPDTYLFDHHNEVDHYIYRAELCELGIRREREEASNVAATA